MAKTTITINAKDTNGKKITNNITYVNPEITDTNALILAQKISSLTSDYYVSAERINSIELNTNKLPRIISRVRLWSGSNSVSYTTDLDGDIIEVDFPLSQFVASKQLSPSFNSNSFSERMELPIITGDFPCRQYTWAGPDGNTGSNANVWSFNFNAAEQVAQTVQWSFLFPESEHYLAKQFIFKINIVDRPLSIFKGAIFDDTDDRELKEIKEEEY